jgi:hypothetical protein
VLRESMVPVMADDRFDAATADGPLRSDGAA